ncbi:MAG: leucine-rich repeat domain-containing protein [Clostridia bacterium]|nr:leucine-rich repeat domain-containing protein [Clostridia bacterium]
MKKKILVLLLTLTIVCALFALVACSGGSGNNYNEDGSVNYSKVFKINDDGTITSLTRFGKTLESIVIPEEIDGKKVTGIGEKVFGDLSKLKNIEIPSGVTSIGFCAFLSCDNLKSVGIPSSVTSIEDRAFAYCSSLESVTFGEDSQLTSLGEGVFVDCSSLTSIAIPSNVNSIGDSAFSGCISLTSIEIPSGVTSIGDHAFGGCSLTSVIMPTIAIGKVSSSDTLKTVVINGGTNISEEAFWNYSSLTSIEIPSSVTSIGDYAFYDCSSLTSVEIPSSVTSICEGAFSGCISLHSIVGLNSEISIGEDAFLECDIYAIWIPSTIVDSMDELEHYLDVMDRFVYISSVFCESNNVPDGGFVHSGISREEYEQIIAKLNEIARE